jgi:basic amino acid/polyamine antiporter, APA family
VSRTIGLFGATAVGVGAIVGGGIFVLAGVAFASAGPGALLAFALNGVIAVLTAMSFAEMATASPTSGGPYVFAKRVLSVRSAFGVGWILWFAYIVAAVLYALGFASYAALAVRTLAGADGSGFLASRAFHLLLALGAVGVYLVGLLRRPPGQSDWATYGKVVLFGVLIGAGVIALFGSPSGTVSQGMSPFLPAGMTGLLAAMGFTFIAVQGFDLVAAVAGEVKEPERTIPRAMFLALGLAMLIYLPLLLLVATVGVPWGTSIVALSAGNPETVMALAAEHFMGRAGYWVVVVAAVLSTLSALRANLLAASRVSASMAEDRTLPHELGRRVGRTQAPVLALYASALAVVALILALPDVASAGAAASLIFLLTFALAHWTALLARRRHRAPPPYRSPWFPAVPVVGGLACAGLTVFQAVVVPSAGLIVLLWLALGGFLYVARFAGRAEAVDAVAEAQDPDLLRLRGRRPLVLVPVANPATAPLLAGIATALAPPEVGRVLLLSVVPPGGDDLSRIDTAQAALRVGLGEALRGGHAPQALITVWPDAFEEVGRVARERDCESLLLGLTRPADEAGEARIEALMSLVECDVVVLHSPPEFELAAARRILVPMGGRGGHDALRARLLASLSRGGKREVTFLKVVPAATDEAAFAAHQRDLERLAREEAGARASVEIVRNGDVVASIMDRAREFDIVVLGVQRSGRRRLFGRLALGVARATPGATILISRRS